MSANPFETLGLPADQGLPDERVRAAWRQIAAATHPDRADGGDLDRYTQAGAAYAELRTAWGRSEAYADLVERSWRAGAAGDEPDTVPLPVVAAGQLPPPVPPWQPLVDLALLPVRIRHGRPVRLLIRGVAALALCLIVLAVIPGQPAAPADVGGLIVWFVLTGRRDLAPPPER